MKIKIGITPDVSNDHNVVAFGTYVKALECVNALPIVLPYTTKDETLEELMALCDGILFTGGVDVDPKHYGAEKQEACGEIEPYRDELELKVFDMARKAGKPILAICRGIQLVNVAMGGTLYQDLPSEAPSEIAHSQSEGKFDTSHCVQVTADTPLYDLVGADRIVANSFHHQAIERLADGLAVMAVADDGIIEAVYGTDLRYLRAYQWHPERLVETHPPHRAIFEDFIRSCRESNRLDRNA